MKRTIIFSLMIFAVIIGGWYLLLGQPAKARVATIEKDIFAERRKLGAYRVALARFDEMIKEYNRLNTSFDEYPVSFSGKDEVVSLYQVLDSLCHQPGYNLKEITPSLEDVIQFLREWAQSDSTITIPIRVKIEASYSSLAQLIEAVEESKYFNRLTFCRLNGSDNLYPDCSLDLIFVASLGNRMEMFDLE